MEWRNQVAVVTGGARGLGRSTARLLAQRGAAVCVNYMLFMPMRPKRWLPRLRPPSWPNGSRWQLRDFAGWMCAAAPCTMTGVSTGSRLQDHDLAERSASHDPTDR